MGKIKRIRERLGKGRLDQPHIWAPTPTECYELLDLLEDTKKGLQALLQRTDWHGSVADEIRELIMRLEE